MSADTSVPIKVGALARRTGLSVRTLHHYDEIGLLRPSQRTPSGHRLYAHADVSRLQQIQSLRMTGIPLDEIRQLLDQPDLTAQRVIQLHLDRIQLKITLQQRLADRLRRLAHHLDTAKTISTEDLYRIIEDMQIMEKYFTTEQLTELEQRRQSVSQERMDQVGAEWAEIIPAVRAHMAKGTPTDDPALLALAERWRGLVHEFTGGNRDIAQNVRTMYQHEGAALAQKLPNTPDQEMFGFMGKVFAHLPGGGPG
jgi:MerR family transcriptional regulator, thiopeptide resistance regulator